MKGVFFAVLLPLFFAGGAFCGNKAMVEKNVEELDSLNKEAVKSVPDIPKEGKVELKAFVKQKEGGHYIELIDYNVSRKIDGSPSSPSPAKDAKPAGESEPSVIKKEKPTDMKEEKLNVPL